MVDVLPFSLYTKKLIFGLQLIHFVLKLKYEKFYWEANKTNKTNKLKYVFNFINMWPILNFSLLNPGVSQIYSN